ncbi:putative RNA methyltransferase [Ornithinibacillus sp. 4-3]|uniref:RNA methyltransferase n=1 Tax=Ornithinibacillus sp. 4-3 TaxID=3231488 RepID=A0AB39HRU8_9BACI
MSNKEKSAKLVQKYEDKLRCPICEEQVQVVELRSLQCANNHSFDFAKQGYINMLMRSVKTPYDKALFASRQEVIRETNLYTKLHASVADILKTHLTKEITILDAGCGEGSHLEQIMKKSDLNNMLGIGIDIAKEGVLRAAKHYHHAIWLVGDLANAPLANQSCNAIINILSPANYQEFKRILSEEGIVVKVIPGKNYFRELREALYADDKQTYSNEDTVELFENQFQLIEHMHVQTTESISEQELEHLINMSPLAWNIEEGEKDQLRKHGIDQLTIDLEILVGKKSDR